MAELNFDSNKGVVIPETQDVRTDLAASVQEAFRTDPSQPVLDTDATSPMGQVVDIIAAEVQAKNSEIAFLAAMSSLSTSRGAFLDALGSLYGVERKLSEPTIVTCICTGLKGTTIPYGAIVQDSLGNQFRHSTAGGASIGEAGTVQTNFSSVEHGEIEVLPDSVTKIVTIVAGWDSITNPNSGATGRVKEPDGEYMNRIMQSYAINALGSLEAIQAKLSSVDGVLDCVVLENFTNEYQTKYGIRIDPHSIAICIVGGEDGDIAEAIYRSKDLGCGTTGNYSVGYVAKDHFDAKYTYQITRPESEDFMVQVTFFETSMPDEDQIAVKEAIIADFLGEGTNPRIKLATTAYASRFYPIVQKATDTPLRDVVIGLGTGEKGTFVEIPANIEPSISADTISLVFATE